MHSSALLFYELANGNHMIMRRLLVDRYAFSELALVVSNRLPYFLEYAALINLFTPQMRRLFGCGVYCKLDATKNCFNHSIIIFGIY